MEDWWVLEENQKDIGEYGGVFKRMKINYLGKTITNSKIDGEINKFESNDDIKAKYR